MPITTNDAWPGGHFLSVNVYGPWQPLYLVAVITTGSQAMMVTLVVLTALTPLPGL